MKKVFADKRINVAIIMAISVVNLWVSFMMAAQLYAESRLIPNIRKTREIIGNKSNHITLIYSVL